MNEFEGGPFAALPPEAHLLRPLLDLAERDPAMPIAARREGTRLRSTTTPGRARDAAGIAAQTGQRRRSQGTTISSATRSCGCGSVAPAAPTGYR